MYLSPSAGRLYSASSIASLPLEARTNWLASLSPAELDHLETDWQFWARPEQLAPAGDWRRWVILAGRGWGKTATGGQWVRDNACGDTPLTGGTFRLIAIVAETAKDARQVIAEGPSGILAAHPKDFRPSYTEKGGFTWPNGARGLIYNATEPDQLRGPNFDAAWCFVAGTSVATVLGEKPIEKIQNGDLVLTRKGYRCVTAIATRVNDVGKVLFSTGSSLTGTPEHLVYTANRGWIRLDSLSIGDIVCATNVSRMAARSGTVTETDTTSEPTRNANPRRSTFIAKYGAMLMAQYCRALKSITATKTKRITTSPTFNASRNQNTSLSIIAKGEFREERICPVHRQSTLRALDVASDCCGGGARQIPDAGHARRGLSRNGANDQKSVVIAGSSLEAGSVFFAARVVSTWQPQGQQRVFCLTVAGEAEYIANGIVVHNCDELAKWRYARETWDMLQFGLRLGTPRQLITTTPRPIPLLKEILALPNTAVTRGKTEDNAANLSKEFLEDIKARYEGTRLGRQELNGEILDDIPGALWTRATIDERRIAHNALPPMVRVVVGIDPAAKVSHEGDSTSETGIIVAGFGEDGRGYVLDDLSCRLSPMGWARKAVAAYDRYSADAIVVEINQGGAMVKTVLQAERGNLPVREVRASKGKTTRAEPVAALYEQGRISHAGAFATLEDQMMLFTPFGIEGDGAADRVDALVWAFSDLFPRIVKRDDATKWDDGGHGQISGGWLG